MNSLQAIIQKKKLEKSQTGWVKMSDQKKI